ncbi:MAG: PKD domain-containing protein, partial [Intrasporangium sp.]
TVTATAKAQRVVWTMGDGSTITCTGPGTPYADSYGKKSSPTCGHTYTREGKYTVRATSFWVVTWSGIGQSGTIPLNFTDTAAITMGEAQVLTQ